MELSLVQRRIYVDTFGGGDYSIDMEENLGLRVPFSETDLVFGQQPDETLYKTEQQKKLYEDFQNRRREAHS